MTNRIGRPMKYRAFLAILDNDVAYTPASIYYYGKEKGLVDGLIREEVARARQEDGTHQEGNAEELKAEAEALVRRRIRHTLKRFSINHNFPKPQDGEVVIHGQVPYQGSYGWRWKTAAGIAFGDAC